MAHGLLDHGMGNVATSSAHVLKVARKPWAVISTRARGSIHFLSAPEFIRLRSVNRAMLDNGLPRACPGKTKRETCPFCICLTISTARSTSGTRKPSLRCWRSLRFASGTVHSAWSRSNSSHAAFKTASVRTLVRIRNSRARAATASRAQIGHERRHLIVWQVGMAALGQLRGRLKPHRLQVCPTRGIVRHHDAVLVTEQDAGVLEDASDRWVQLPGDFGFVRQTGRSTVATSTVVISCTGRASKAPEYAAPR